MKVVCECTLSKDRDLKKSALENLVKIVFLYYEHIIAYMEALLKVYLKITKDYLFSNSIGYRSLCFARNRILVNNCWIRNTISRGNRTFKTK